MAKNEWLEWSEWLVWQVASVMCQMSSVKCERHDAERELLPLERIQMHVGATIIASLNNSLLPPLLLHNLCNNITYVT